MRSRKGVNVKYLIGTSLIEKAYPNSRNREEIYDIDQVNEIYYTVSVDLDNSNAPNIKSKTSRDIIETYFEPDAAMAIIPRYSKHLSQRAVNTVLSQVTLTPGTVQIPPSNNTQVSVFKVGDILKDKGKNTTYRYIVKNVTPGYWSTDSLYDLERVGDPSAKYGFKETTLLALFELADQPSNYEANNTTCIHNWLEYNGFTEDYIYCAKCDEKQRKKG
jgi:hypothetical protein